MSRKSGSPEIERKHYFVDEAGDPTLFGARGKVLVGSEGCSRFFILGLADVEDPPALVADLTRLRARLIADLYFKDVPSMQPKQRKTALLFHAKDDLPEVRREVFALLQRHAIRFSAIVRDKLAILAYVRRRNDADPAYRYRPNELYDFMVRRLFRERLHKHSAYRVCFAKRGQADRTEALTQSLDVARRRFIKTQGASVEVAIEVVPASLQAVDYFLWAVQRTFEKHEDRFLRLLWPQCSLVVDADDIREKAYGRYYTQQRPLTAAALEEAEGYRSQSPR
jgi:hypothetical protein